MTRQKRVKRVKGVQKKRIGVCGNEVRTEIGKNQRLIRRKEYHVAKRKKKNRRDLTLPIQSFPPSFTHLFAPTSHPPFIISLGHVP